MQRTKPAFFVFIYDLVFTIFVAFFLFTAGLAPMFKILGFTAQGEICYNITAFICHQIPERCFQLLDFHFGICSRCTGIYLGIMLIRMYYQIDRQGFCRFRYSFFYLFTKPFIYILLISLMIVEWQLSHDGIIQGSLWTRFFSGVAFGIGWLGGPHLLICRAMRRFAEKLLVQRGVLRNLRILKSKDK
ncbi:MAG: DUF2085 domain-containing protein [Candidatus Aminicenantes bacterium]|nr:DUF2085 domain-containing protein [Candidatus Aminicenantes bacterium]